MNKTEILRSLIYLCVFSKTCWISWFLTKNAQITYMYAFTRLSREWEMLQITLFTGVRFFAWKSGCVKNWTNIISGGIVSKLEYISENWVNVKLRKPHMVCRQLTENASTREVWSKLDELCGSTPSVWSNCCWLNPTTSRKFVQLINGASTSKLYWTKAKTQYIRLRLFFNQHKNHVFEIW